MEGKKEEHKPDSFYFDSYTEFRKGVIPDDKMTEENQKNLETIKRWMSELFQNENTPNQNLEQELKSNKETVIFYAIRYRGPDYQISPIYDCMEAWKDSWKFWKPRRRVNSDSGSIQCFLYMTQPIVLYHVHKYLESLAATYGRTYDVTYSDGNDADVAFGYQWNIVFCK